ncbi:rhomboid family intramembrane serine protease [Granulicella rosea]|nr:rhomboid family intramembrane serine protease [Granulicella rosea]
MPDSIQHEDLIAAESATPASGFEAPSSAHHERSDFNPLAAPATYTLIAINLAVFGIMFPRSPAPEVWRSHHPGMAFLASFSPEDLVRYGAVSGALVLGGQWYRLVTAAFVHINPAHILTNLWCLWNLGLLGEPLLGPMGLIAVYILTGVAGYLLSIAWDILFHPALANSLTAGASGAIFGIAGILIVLLSNRRLPIPWKELRGHRNAVLLFAVVNLALGGVSIYFSAVRINNSAHLGGVLSGLLLGLPLVPRMTAGRLRYLRRQKIVFAGAAFVLSLFGYWISRVG